MTHLSRILMTPHFLVNGILIELTSFTKILVMANKTQNSRKNESSGEQETLSTVCYPAVRFKKSQKFDQACHFCIPARYFCPVVNSARYFCRYLCQVYSLYGVICCTNFNHAFDFRGSFSLEL